MIPSSSSLVPGIDISSFTARELVILFFIIFCLFRLLILNPFFGLPCDGLLKSNLSRKLFKFIFSGRLVGSLKILITESKTIVKSRPNKVLLTRNLPKCILCFVSRDWCAELQAPPSGPGSPLTASESSVWKWKTKKRDELKLCHYQTKQSYNLLLECRFH